ncbi:hypothetical protein OIU84_029725 [Salix udensis]|uniref:Uncharacterized protein n=1 Tax=Salix udensis TaxID=889485 RepID=A0AAD6K9Z7_9ROSI|nr:hypothetical protein OIU84_029725 [Salix udensis]
MAGIKSSGETGKIRFNDKLHYQSSGGIALYLNETRTQPKFSPELYGPHYRLGKVQDELEWSPVFVDGASITGTNPALTLSSTIHHKQSSSLLVTFHIKLCNIDTH